MSPSPHTAATTRRPRVLIVDDEPVFGAALRRALAGEYRIDIASDAQEAETAITREPGAYDVVLCDLWMPVVTGLRLRERLLERGLDIPCFVFMSGALPNLVRELAGDEPLVLEKPFSVRELRKVLQSAVEPEAPQ